MLEIIKQTKNNVNPVFEKDIIKSFNNYAVQNDYQDELSFKATLQDFWDKVEEEEIFIVMSRHKVLGFFLHKYHNKNEEISFQIFISPLACPKSNVSLVKCAVTNSLIEFTNKPQYKYLEFTTGHPIMATATKAILPDINIKLITPSHILCYKKIDNKDLLIFKVFCKTYIKTDTPDNYNKYELLR